MNNAAGTAVHIFREEDIPPLKSQNTWMVAAALASGITLADRPYSDSVETLADGTTKRIIVWFCKPDKAIFRPIPAEEEVDAAEFSRRFHDKEWWKENPDHPIAYMRCLVETYSKLRDWLRQRKPSALIRRGGRVAIIDADCPQAVREKILSYLQ